MSDPYYNGGGGGGFMPSSQGGGEDKPKNKTNATLRSITIKQFMQASQPHPEADWLIDNVDISQVTLVGTVRNVAEQTSHTVVVIEDGTGSVECRKWKSPEDDEDAAGTIQQDTYVRVIGTIKTFSNKRHLAVSAIRPVVDLNEVFYHLAEAQYMSLLMKRGKPEDSLGGGRMAGMTSGGGGGNTNDYTMGGGGGGGGGNLGQYSDLPQIQQRIMAICQIDPPEEGFHVKTIGNKLKQYNGDAILEAIESLIAEGHLYTAMDDEHVLSTA